MSIWNKPVWIWANESPAPDEYAEFADSFDYEGGKVSIKISADSQYAVYLNGVLCAQGQYPDFPHYKVYDEIDLTEWCNKGKNTLSFVVWYIGKSNFSYCPGKAALAYEVSCEGEIVAKSGEDTLARLSRTYAQHKLKILTGQLGYSFDYDATAYDGWMTGIMYGFGKSYIVEQDLPMFIRPCLIPERLPVVIGKECIRISDTDIVYDLGKEYVGLFSIKVNAPRAQKLLVAYGEHIKDGCVRQCINGRDFSVEYTAPEGESEYVSPFRRLAGRYLEVHSETPLDDIEVGLVPTVYPLKDMPKPALTDKQQVIYEMCVETLRLCMHEHYEDCPWREQGLYCMDSRNQMLCGYYAFDEKVFPKSNLRLISKDRQESNLLSICYPMQTDHLIPSFSLHYITECAEYVEHSGDSDFAAEVAPKCRSILSAFRERKVNGVIPPFDKDPQWNFYEWTDAVSNGSVSKDIPDVLGNTLYSLALQNFAKFTPDTDEAKALLLEAEEMNVAILDTFSVPGTVALSCRPHGDEGFTELGNSLAILCGAVKGEDAVKLAEMIADRGNNGMTYISLSMMCFKYDALLKVGGEKYKDYILEDIERVYTPMIEFGSTTVWECEGGPDSFALAGSLCHGWSAMPVYYYHKLLK